MVVVNSPLLPLSLFLPIMALFIKFHVLTLHNKIALLKGSTDTLYKLLSPFFLMLTYHILSGLMQYILLIYYPLFILSPLGPYSMVIPQISLILRYLDAIATLTLGLTLLINWNLELMNASSWGTHLSPKVIFVMINQLKLSTHPSIFCLMKKYFPSVQHFLHLLHLNIILFLSLTLGCPTFFTHIPLTLLLF